VSGFENLTLERRAAVGLVHLNRAERSNSLTMELFAELEQLARCLEEDADIRCVVLTGAGRHFCAGIELQVLAETTSQWSARHVFRLQESYNRLAALPQPVIAAVNGACIGGGLELALACDIRIAAADAVFSVPEVSFGLSPDLGGSQRLPRVVGPSQAKRLLLGCERIDAAEAARIGLVDEVVEPGRLINRALELAGRIAAQPPMAVRFAKKAVNVAMESSLAAGLLYEQAQSVFCLGSADKNEAVSAFFEKRHPEFKGR
jgi:enoyl-CoA hydratase